MIGCTPRLAVVEDRKDVLGNEPRLSVDLDDADGVLVEVVGGELPCEKHRVRLRFSIDLAPARRLKG
jgi:hypothetical protein